MDCPPCGRVRGVSRVGFLLGANVGEKMREHTRLELAGRGREDFVYVFGGLGPAGWREAFGVSAGDHWRVIVSIVCRLFFLFVNVGIVRAYGKLRLRHL